MSETTAPLGGSGEMFDGIAARYDRMNRILSFGMDQGWRRKAVRALELKAGERVLDVATGTADVAIEIARSEDVAVIGLDPSTKMLAVGERKVRSLGLADRVRLTEGDAVDLPFEDGAFNAVSIAFGIRNVPDRPRALAEFHRVLRPGGRLAILELNEPDGGFVAPFARFYVRTMVPTIGAVLSGASEYRYLERSIAAFPSPKAFRDLVRDAGFPGVRAQPLSFGACTLYAGIKG